RELQDPPEREHVRIGLPAHGGQLLLDPFRLQLQRTDRAPDPRGSGLDGWGCYGLRHGLPPVSTSPPPWRTKIVDSSSTSAGAFGGPRINLAAIKETIYEAHRKSNSFSGSWIFWAAERGDAGGEAGRLR